MKVVVVRDPGALAEHVPAWEAMAAEALEPNIFYEPWMFLPAVTAFGGRQDIRIALVFGPDSNRPTGPPLLCGFFPLVLERFHRLPLGVYRSFRHDHGPLATPLLRASCAAEALNAFLDWLETDQDGPPLLELRSVRGDGLFHQVLLDRLRARNALWQLTECYSRALFRLTTDGDTYLRQSLSGNTRRNLKRKERRLSEIGQLEYFELGASGDLDTWCQAFLRLESSGWKGREGGALACVPAAQTFFVAVAKEAFRRGRLHMLGLHLDGRPIAQRCNFLAGEGSFFWKPAFDEEYARFSPGLLLEVENIHRLHDRSYIRWMDSCTSPDESPLNDLWSERRVIESILIATGRRPGDLLVSVEPLLRWVRRVLTTTSMARSA